MDATCRLARRHEVGPLELAQREVETGPAPAGVPSVLQRIPSSSESGLAVENSSRPFSVKKPEGSANAKVPSSGGCVLMSARRRGTSPARAGAAGKAKRDNRHSRDLRLERFFMSLSCLRLEPQGPGLQAGVAVVGGEEEIAVGDGEGGGREDRRIAPRCQVHDHAGPLGRAVALPELAAVNPVAGGEEDPVSRGDERIWLRDRIGRKGLKAAEPAGPRGSAVRGPELGV